MTIEIRPMRRADIPRTFTLIRTAYPCMVFTEPLMVERFDRPLTYFRDQRFIAVEGDQVIGHVLSRLYEDENGRTHGQSYMAAVTPRLVDGDLPDRLLETSERRLLDDGAEFLSADTAEESVQIGGEGFRRAILERGYELTENARILGLDLATIPEPPPAPEGAELRTFREFDDDPRPVYEIDRATSEDEPGGLDNGFLPYEDWIRVLWHNPLADNDLSLVLLLDGVPVTISCYKSDGEGRMESGMTGTLRGYRGRGLAAYTKTKALHLAREKGIRRAYTGNHADNEPMLAINERLGYGVVGSEQTYRRT
ncbi:MAG TPA: GNAT family N-acetyltransferase [Nocardiopsis listeri]|uniref:GNAT family N-acetyltransferase n=1 Tax=Nocardiopsis listeri TaxID=53440 RepID=UPI001D64C1E4|nr:GNAT family N-acetyltransferase [Nocardiopsis listeri]HJE57900.1 GNAT family N-acetyltransferase [Nocardiopsis listeri]